MKTTSILGAAALLTLAGCASADLRAAGPHCPANLSSRVVVAECVTGTTQSARGLGKVQQRISAVDAALRQGA